MDLSNVYPCRMEEDAVEAAEVVELQDELSGFHALDEDTTEEPERHECDPQGLIDEDVCVSAMEEDERDNDQDDDDPVCRSFRDVAVKRDLLSERDLDPGSYKCNCDEHCLKKIPREKFVNFVASVKLLTRQERSDTVPLLLFPGYLFPGYTSACRTSRKHRKTSDSMQDDYSHLKLSVMGHTVCRRAFCSLFGITDSALGVASARIKSMQGALPLIKRKGKQERKKKDSDKEEIIIEDLENYARRNGYPSPCGRIPGAATGEKEKEILILSSNMDRKSVWEEIMKGKQDVPYSFSYFMRVWRESATHVKIAQRGTDFCNTCCSIMRSHDDDKWSLLKRHQDKAMIEKKMYHEIVQQTMQNDNQMHFSFDFAQAIQIPHERMEPKDAFFDHTFKIDLFGVSCETERRNYIFVLPEGSFPAKDATSSNHVIAMVDTILRNVPSSVRKLYLHADNCSAQNKNRFLFGYLSYLLALGRFDKIQMMFMLEGHTKFALDGAFGLFKRYFRGHSGIYTIPDVVDAVDKSSRRNTPMTAESVRWLDWRAYLEQFGVDFPLISKMHVMYATKEDPMTWTCFANSTDMKEGYHRHEICIFKRHFAPTDLIDPSSFDPGSVTDRLTMNVPLAPLKHLSVRKVSRARKQQLLKHLPHALTEEKMLWWTQHLDEVSEGDTLGESYA
eukprot:TRINITY_DN1949_c0_g1_i1.p1 TRINITY_DN1949_c0_g1~~TRINITY_DN1949_c0_g1_i1.p1  ORF type:complete len:674 (-),score=154.89 TRINITY_DN1949_c0_g1_i1:1412-3433(-)